MSIAKLSVVLLSLFVLSESYASANEKQYAEAVGSKVKLVTVKKKDGAKSEEAVSKIIINGRAVKTFHGNDPEISDILESNNAAVMIVNYGTYGNHCSATQYFVIGIGKNKKSKVFDDGNFTLCNAEEFQADSDKNSIWLSWRESASNVRYLTYYPGENKFKFQTEIINKRLETKDFDEIYRVYKEMCHYSPYGTKEFSKYIMSPSGYYSDTYSYYSTLLENGRFKYLCFEGQLNDDAELLDKDSLLKEMGLR